jgi:hypothetical protein
VGRQLRRVPLDFEWPLHKVWHGYINQFFSASQKCPACAGMGYSIIARELQNIWYGRGDIQFHPQDRGSIPFTPEHPVIHQLAKRNTDHSILSRRTTAYGHLTIMPRDMALHREALRLCDLFNGSWSHHLNDDDVAALVKNSRLHDFTHDFIKGRGWIEKNPPVIPSAHDVNAWSLAGFGHDSINQYCCVEAECQRMGQPLNCELCGGGCQLWPSDEAKKLYDDWECTHPPEGDGYQMWETTSEGSPISPVFAAPEELAVWLSKNRKDTVDEDTTADQWLAFIRGPGWAPSFIGGPDGLLTGVEAIVEQEAVDDSETL